jgi:hypothetical protein
MTAPYALVSSALLSGVVFFAATLPLTLMGSQPVTIKVSEDPVFSGRLEELATPYLGFTTLLSLGVGAATFGLLGWQSSSRKLNHAEQQIAALKQQIQEAEASLEHLKFSETRLQTAGLNHFLDPGAVVPQPASILPLNGQPTPAERPSSSFLNTGIHPQVESPMAAAHPKSSIQSLLQDANQLHDTTQLEGLLSHLKQVMGQIERLQTSQSQNAAQNHLIKGTGTAIS